jgi:hypothetical protein
MSRKVPKSLRIVLNPNPNLATPLDAAEYYLCSGEVKPLEAYQAAISCLLSPLGKAISGCSQAEIEEAIARSRTQFEIFMALAQNRCKGNFDNSGCFPKSTTNSSLENVNQLSPVMTNGHPVEDNDSNENLDLENERL